MNMTAREVGRQLVLTIGGPTEEMDEEDRAIAAANVKRFVVPPVNAQQGAEIWAHYARILFAQAEEEPEEEIAVRMAQIAFGAWAPDDAPEAEQQAARDRWAELNELRWNEAEAVVQACIYWQSQGGGIDAVELMLRDGHPKAQELMLTRNELWNVYSRLRMLMQSQSSDAAKEILERVASSDTNTPTGTSDSGERDAFGIRQTA